MPLGTAWTPTGNIGLWHINYQINADDRGFHFGLSVAEKTESQVLAIGNDIGARLMELLPKDAEIYYATYQKDDSPRDAGYLHLAVGQGKQDDGATPPIGLKYDQPRTAVYLRMEDVNRFPVTRKWCPIPDGLVTDGKLTAPPDPVIGLPGALPALPTHGEGFKVTLNGLMQALVLQTHHIKAGHSPGGAYTYENWKNCFFMRIGSKKGGRVFIG